MSEKRVMMQLRHPFLIRLYKTYKDRDRLYLLLEPSLGGELFSVLRARYGLVGAFAYASGPVAQ